MLQQYIPQLGLRFAAWDFLVRSTAAGDSEPLKRETLLGNLREKLNAARQKRKQIVLGKVHTTALLNRIQNQL